MLSKLRFRWEHLPLVQDFDCGDEPWEREIANYLKSEAADGALTQSEERGNGAWLYFNEDRALVGYAVIGLTNWRWPDPKTKKQYPHAVAIGVDRRFSGQPPGPREGRYSWQIVTDLMAEVLKYPDVGSVLTLFVHESNARAIAFYRNLQFEFVPGLNYVDRTTASTYLAMAVKLP